MAFASPSIISSLLTTIMLLQNFAAAADPSHKYMTTAKLKEKLLDPYSRPEKKEEESTEETCSSKHTIAMFGDLVRPAECEFAGPSASGVADAALMLCERCRPGELACGVIRADLENSFGGGENLPKASPAAFVLYYEMLMDKWRDLRGPVALVPKQRKIAFDSALDVAGRIYGPEFADNVKKAYEKRAAAQPSFKIPTGDKI